jgi:hypothetical protein
MRYAIKLLAAIAAIAFVYLAGAFVELEMDFRKWSQLTRIIFVTWGPAFAAIGFMFNGVRR